RDLCLVVHCLVRLSRLYYPPPSRPPFPYTTLFRSAPLGPMLREAVIGEWLHATGTPTTRALAVLTTGEQIAPRQGVTPEPGALLDRKSTRLNSSHVSISYAVFCLKKKKVSHSTTQC